MTIAARAIQAMRPAEYTIPASYPLGEAWYVVYTNIRCEFRAHMGLKAKGFDTFLPFIRKKVRHARYTHLVDRPLFPRYLFVKFDIERDAWFDPIKSTDGVEDLLRNDSLPVRIRDAELAPIMRAQRMGEFDMTRKRPRESEFKKDEIVRISGGPFIGFNAEVLAILPDKERAEVALQLFGRASKIEINYDHLEKL